jgi:hypothetical protein
MRSASQKWIDYNHKTESIDWLKAHRDWVEENHWGFGDRPLHYMWHELLESLPNKAVLMEIGVFRGQVVSLWALISQKLNKDFKVYGQTVLNKSMSDPYATHPAVTMSEIERICRHFGVEVNIINKDSLDEDSRAPEPLDLLFIDGGHDYNTVINDIDKFTPSLKPSGLVVFDDASETLEEFGHWFKGIEAVSRAVDEFAQRDDYKEQERLGYVRIFRKS